MVFQCTRSCLRCCIKNYKYSSRNIKRFRHVANDWNSHQKRNRNDIIPTRYSQQLIYESWVRSRLGIQNLSYLDANNLYGWAISKQHPTFGFEWMTDDELDDWKHLSCIFEVDLEYREDLPNLHIDNPLAPERVKIGNVEKLIPNLNNKTNYVVYYENLKWYESSVEKLQRFIEVLNSKKVPGWKNTLV